MQPYPLGHESPRPGAAWPGPRRSSVSSKNWLTADDSDCLRSRVNRRTLNEHDVGTFSRNTNRSIQTSGQSNLANGRIAAARKSFNCIRQLAPISTPHLLAIGHIHGSLAVKTALSFFSRFWAANCVPNRQKDKCTYRNHGTRDMCSNKPHLGSICDVAYKHTVYYYVARALGHVPPRLPTIYFVLLHFGAIQSMAVYILCEISLGFACHSH